MAALATIIHRFRPDDGLSEAPRTHDASARVRAFANDDIYFWVKKIDNLHVVRAADPRARNTCWKMIGSVGIAVVLLIGVLLPSAYSLLAGYQIQSLQNESQRLQTEQSALELQEAQLLSPARMEELARTQQFIDPPSAQVVYLESKAGSLAMNHSK